MLIIAIDPGNEQSAYVLINSDYRPLYFDKADNKEVEAWLHRAFIERNIDEVVIEMVASYGMAVGASVFDTCVEIGRLQLIAEQHQIPVRLVKRKEYVTELCGSSRAKDANVIQYLIDRFAPSTPNRGKGTKKAPGWFYGFKADIWQACAIGVWGVDTHTEVDDG